MCNSKQKPRVERSAVCTFIGLFYRRDPSITERVRILLSKPLTEVFQSNFIEGESNGVDVSGGGQGQTMMVQTLKAHEPFEVLHPILYFLYTDRVCFTTAPIEEATVIHQVPPCDAEQAYRIGDMLELPQLKSKALEFLVDTADATNIISRVFGEYALKYEEIGKAYEGVFYRCWNDLKKGEVLKQYFRDLREEDEAKKNDVTTRCLHIMQGLISSGQREE
jgi:hypothetical protein